MSHVQKNFARNAPNLTTYSLTLIVNLKEKNMKNK